MKEYYYLCKSEKIGPISEADLLKLNLDAETLIWEENFANWMKLSEIPELNKKLPPPPPEEYIKQTKRKSKKVRNSFLSFFILLFLFSGITFLILFNHIKSSKIELENRVESIFAGRNIICSGINYRVEGELKRVFLKDNITDFSGLWGGSDDFELIKESRNRGYYDFYSCNRGGFEIKKLTKIDNGYELEYIYSTNMAYTSYYSYRPDIQTCYSNAYDYFIESNDGCFSKGIYPIISNFPEIRSNLHYIVNVKKPSYPYTDHWWSSGEGNIYNDYRKLYYKTDNKYYEIRLNRYNLKDSIKSFTLIELGILIILLIFLFTLNPFKW